MHDHPETPDPEEPGDQWTPTVLDALAAPDDVAQWAADAAPGSLTVGLLAVLNPTAMSYAGLVEASVGIEHAKAWLEARQHAIHAQLAERTVPGAAVLGKGWVREEIGCALNTSFGAAAARLAVAQELAERLPATLAMLERGRITPGHARVLAEAVFRFDQTTASKIEKRVLARAPQQPLHLFKRSLDRAVKAADPASAEQRRTRAEADRCVRFRPGEDSMTDISGLLTAEDAAMLDAVLQAMATAQTDPAECRTVEQRRADALVELAADRLADDPSHAECSGQPGSAEQSTGSGDPGNPGDRSPYGGRGPLPTSHGRRARIQVTVALSTLLGLDEQPAELDGYGAIPAQVARRIAADETSTWYRLITDSRGRLVEAGTTRYRPPKDLTEYLIARDGTCRYPGCARPACRCEIDHQRPFSEGGLTCRSNTECLCCRHHHAKHDGGWRAHGDPQDELTWISPAGKTYSTRPAEYPVDHTADPPNPTDDPDPPPF